jgi:hypothetical protein
MTETDLANSVALALEQAGLDVFRLDKLATTVEPWQDTTWRALAESAALIAILPSEGPLAASVAVEVGAFKAWHKPIYVIQAASGNIRIPTNLADCPVYPLSRLDDVVASIKRGFGSLSNDDRAVLAAIYSDLRTPADQILANPAAIDSLAEEFHARSGKMVAGERLVRELLVLRKRGDLPRLRR